MKQKIRTASILLLMILGTGLVLMACGSKSLADSRTAGSDSYGLKALWSKLWSKPYEVSPQTKKSNDF